MKLLSVHITRSRKQSPHHPEAGVALIEFALVLPILLLILLGILDFGKAFNYWNDETHLANEGARLAAVDKNVTTLPDANGATNLCQYLKQQTDTAQLKSDAKVTVSMPVGAKIGDPVTVTVSDDFTFLPYLQAKGITNKTITGKSVMRLEANPTNNAGGCSI